MSDTIKKNIDIAIEEEDTEGTYKAPSANSSYLAALEDNIEATPAKEVLSRNVLNGSIHNISPRHGAKSVSGSISVEAKAHGTEGTAPEYSTLMKSCLQGMRNSAEITTGSDHTTDTINIADTSDLSVGDIVVIKESEGYHISPISAITENTSITLLIAASEAPSDSVKIAAFQSYYSADSLASGTGSFSVSKYLDDAVLEKAIGCRVSGMSLENFTTGQLPSFNFSFDGIDFDRIISANTDTPTYDSAYPPVILSACVYVNGSLRECESVSFSVENTLGWKSSTCSSTGRSSSKITGRSITGSFTAYKQSDDVDIFDLLDDETEFSMFFYAYVPSSTSGEYSDSIAFYMPKCKVSSLSDGDAEGLNQITCSFEATKGESNDSTPLVISLS